MTKILHNSIFFSIFAPDFGCIASARPNSINHKRPKNMASIQDIHALEAKIYDAVQEYIDNPKHNIKVPVSHNFVELANINPKKTYDLSKLTLQYYNPAEAVAGDPTAGWHILKLRGHINPGSTFLIRGAQVASTVAPSTIIDVSTFDMEWYEDNKLMAFNAQMGLPVCFDDVEIDEDEFPAMADKFETTVEWAHRPKDVTREGFIQCMKDQNAAGRVFKEKQA